MTTEQELKDKCTPDIIKRMVELAGFIIKFETDEIVAFTSKNLEHKWYIIDHPLAFSTLIHRAVEGWNKKYPQHTVLVYSNGLECWSDSDNPPTSLDFKDYKSNNLTQSECAILHCLLDVFKYEYKKIEIKENEKNKELKKELLKRSEQTPIIQWAKQWLEENKNDMLQRFKY